MIIPKDTLTIECLVQSLQNIIEAKTEHDKARDNYDGYSWDYHGYEYSKQMQIAARDFEDRLENYLNQIIDQRIAAKLNLNQD